MSKLEMSQKDEILYITKMLGKSKSKHPWTYTEKIISNVILSHISQHRIFLNKIERESISTLDSLELSEKIKSIPLKIVYSRDEFLSVTNIDKSNVAREIKSACNGVMEKIVELPNPLNPDDKKSFRLLNWVNFSDYDDKTGNIYIHLNPHIVPYLSVFTEYSVFTKKYLYSMKSPHSIQMYIICGLLLNKHRKKELFTVDIDFLKLNLGISNQYKSINMLKGRVLEVVKKEINDLTDLTFDYELHKTGKRFTHITLKFSQKKDTSKQLDQPKRPPQEIDHQAADAPLNLDVNDQDILIAAQLQSYGIPRNKALEYVKTYGIDVCKVGIEKLLGEIQKGRDISNISGYLVACIENSANNSSSQEIKAAMDAADELVQDRKAQEMERFNRFDTYINNNEQQITVLLARHEANEKLTDELEIDMLRCLKDVVAQYEDLESMSPYYLTLRFKGDILGYSNIKSLVDELEVASKEERISKLKAELEAKKTELEEVGGKAKGLVEKEITMLKVAIADLV